MPIVIIPNDLFFRAYSTIIDVEGIENLQTVSLKLTHSSLHNANT
jgi:hypothetical protein